jgi:hypothetical protein
MIWSGLLIYWANDVYRVGLGGITLFHFFPDWFYQRFGIPQRLAEGMALHFFFMWLFVANGWRRFCTLRSRESGARCCRIATLFATSFWLRFTIYTSGRRRLPGGLITCQTELAEIVAVAFETGARRFQGTRFRAVTVPEMTVLVGGMRALNANAGQSAHGVFTARPGTLSNDFFVNLLDMSVRWSKSSASEGIYDGVDRSTGKLKWTATRLT